jgi:hypothetical protein
MRPSNLSACTLPLLFIGLGSLALAQQPPPACGKPPAILQSTQPNIFSEQQEQWLGEAMADQIDRDYRPVKNAALNAYLNTIGARLLAALPSTNLQFHFTLVESSDINGFSLAGGRVYLTRKLVASAHSEDEVAGVIAHEMGHILSHQFAIETTADLHRLLGITSVTDRADIYAKFQRLTDARLHDKHPGPGGDSDDKQDQADRVAVYAAAAAGYRPQAYAEFWDRSFFVGGKTGNRLGDFFGATKPDQKRLRKIRGLVAELPPGCGATADLASSTFDSWQHLVLQNQAAAPVTPASTAPGTYSETQLTPPLRLDIDRLRFSRDGKYILAQDESSIFVLSRDPFKELFRFDAQDAYPAEFTPDSQKIAFYTRGLHVETWNIAQQKLQSAHEINTQEDCLQTLLAPDARTLVCVAYPANEPELRFLLIDVDTGNIVYEKKRWFQPNFNVELDAMLRRIEKDTTGIFTSSFSADGNLLLIGPGASRLGFDLRTRTPIKLGGALTDYIYPVAYCFAGNNKVYAVNSNDPTNSGIFTFPDGQRLQKIKLSLAWMDNTSGGEFVSTSGPKDAAVALVDVNAGKYVFASRTPAVDVFGTSVVGENPDGTLLLLKLGTDSPKDQVRASLSLSPISGTRTVAVSPDSRYLALSARTRGGVWDLQTGKQLYLVRGFRSAWWTGNGQLIAEFPKREKSPASVVEMQMSPKSARTPAYTLDEQSHLNSGHLLQWKSESKKSWILTARSPVDNSVQWTRQFADGHPGYTTNDGDTDLIFSDLLQSPLAKEKLRNNPTLKSQADAIKQKTAARLIEIVNSTDGTPRAQVVVEVPLTYEGVDGFNRVGDLLYLSIGDNRTIVYSLKTGAQLRQLFGYVVAADQPSQTICIANRRDETIVYDQSGAELQHLTLGSPLRFASLREHGTQLLVLTADQHVRRFTINAATPSTGTGTP